MGEETDPDRYQDGHMYYYPLWLKDDIAGIIKPGIKLKGKIIHKEAEAEVKYKRLCKRVLESKAQHRENPR